MNKHKRSKDQIQHLIVTWRRSYISFK